ncbi:hypothetical protein OV203_09945 [Nannocystis sp. ILAH1]|uniref:hypothetical protein n=1 Tax=Nannocystis sp. ILAH1 TaxID=2996789 RepID=UPI002270D1AB|nr:hypothetical protein [Nannocystis sp. ILAH1]MCY0987445.1 hypothetical protein [Nannocystis sp. ILAH1]
MDRHADQPWACDVRRGPLRQSTTGCSDHACGQHHRRCCDPARSQGGACEQRGEPCQHG